MKSMYLKQVQSDHYVFSKYLTFERWNSYWHQLAEVLACNPRKALIIGVGDKILPAVLKEMGVEVTTFDFDSGLKPDISGDIRDIDTIIGSKSFDVVLCCQVLEHIPFDFFCGTLKKLVNICRSRLIISLPYSYNRLLHVKFKLPKLPQISFVLDVPTFWEPYIFNGEHYWEVGTKGYSKKRIDLIIQNLAPRNSHFFATYNKYHLFYVLCCDEGDTVSLSV